MARRTLGGLAPALLLLAFGSALLATEPFRFSARVIGVTDGDTITVLRDRRPVKIRLRGIDCPERGQAFGAAAKRFTSDLIFGRSVTVEQFSTDRYGRLVADVTVGGQDVSLALVRAGYAWHFTTYSHDPILTAAEQEARTARRGLWNDTHPVPPWVFRRPHRVSTTTQGTSSGPDVYHGNAISRVFHGPTCPSYNCNHCVVIFASRLAAEAAGFRPHTQCVRQQN